MNTIPLTRRRFLRTMSMGGAAALLAACGATSQTSIPTRVPTTVTASYPRTIQDKFGTVELKSQPQRIMNYYGNAGLDALLALGLTPVLIATYDGFTLLPWQSAAEGIPFLVMPDGLPNQEKVFAEKIDLIITAEYPTATKEARDQWLPFSGRIPIISVDQSDFEGQLRIVGAALAMEEAAEEKANEVSQLFSNFIPPRMPETIKAFGTYGDGAFYMFRAASGLSAMIERFGLPPLTAPTTIGDQVIDPEAVHSISFEHMQELEADLLLGTGYTISPLDTVVESPLFQQLGAVKEGRFTAFSNDESFAIAYGSVLSISNARDLLTGALS